MKNVPALLLFALLFCAGICSGQQPSDELSDEQALAAAQTAFVSGKWNPGVFEVMPILKRGKKVTETFPSDNRKELREDLVKHFGDGPCTMVTYQRSSDSLNTNGGEHYCRIIFLVFSNKKVAVIDSRAAERPADKLPGKAL
ncbi:hypothetical protein [Verrucomicrobium sp. BvORR106]|uniref:hypothetical protein n=1 Tax=Verrucomicrobium sp. BvORR106 TaxID=1403819 RepID=UPI000570D763|nr:hypothetical protein [Verrucomicrobium sp. BvORR106]